MLYLYKDKKIYDGKRKRILNTKDVPCCPTYLRDGLDILSTSNENNMAVTYNIPKDSFLKKHGYAITKGQKKESVEEGEDVVLENVRDNVVG